MAKRSVIEVFMGLADLAYKNVYEKFYQTAILEHAQPVPKVHGKCFNVMKSPAPHLNSVDVYGALIIDRLPYKRKQEPTSTERKSSIIVVMDSLDIFKFDGKPKEDNGFLYKSNVHLGYYQRVEKKWRPLLYVRYDFASANDAHPIFHAQLGTGLLNGPSAKHFSDTPAIEPLLNLHQTVRLPTANVIGATALLSLAADHLPIKAFHEMLTVVRKQPFFTDWRCECSSLDVADSPTKMLSSGWYSAK